MFCQLHADGAVLIFVPKRELGMLLLEAIDWAHAPRKAMHIVALLKTKLEHVLFPCDLVFECRGNSILGANACLK